MTDSAASSPVLGIEGGGTRTSALLADEGGSVLASFEVGPANVRLMQSAELQFRLEEIRDQLPCAPARIGIGLAGVRSRADHQRVEEAVALVWPRISCTVTDDVTLALEAAPWPDDCAAQVLLLSGTGSCTLGRHRNGTRLKIGGRGHIIGDRASSCDIAQHALRSCMTISDIDGNWPALGSDILTHLQLNEPEDLVDWSNQTSKTELAGLAQVVFRAAESRRDRIAVAILRRAAERLAKDSVHCARRLAATDERVQFVLNGSVLLKNPEFAESVAARIKVLRADSRVTRLAVPSVWGAVALAGVRATPAPDPPRESPEGADEAWNPVAGSPTEHRHPRSTRFSTMEIADAIALMLEEDATIPGKVLAEADAIEWTIRRTIEAFASNGRLFYAGAGTSGRLGVLDASECPPTFRTPRNLVQGIIAGGHTALWSAVEGAEDDAPAGRGAVAKRNVGPSDVLIGITASGHAPFVWGCLEEARERGATAVLLSCNPAYREHPLPHRTIIPDTGPEILTGSTRLKAGTATKLVLNLITTLALTHSGKVLGNLMVDLNPSNIKLRDRAIRIVRTLTDVDAETARQALQESRWVVRKACLSLGLNIPSG